MDLKSAERTPRNKEQMMQLMVFANLELLPLLEQKKVDLFMDGTWDCTPAPFKQTYIIMIHNQQTGKYVPVNRTNNALESYKRRFNDLLPKKPSLIEFVQILEAESRKQAKELEDICKRRRGKPTYKDHTIPAIPEAYVAFRDAKKVTDAAAQN
jgi:hypothetical protein